MDIAKIPGTFVLGTGEVPGSKSVHLLEWDGRGRRGGRGGVFGWVRCLGSHPHTEQLPPSNFRIHVCSETPCIADYHPSKHGDLPPPLVHLLRLLLVLLLLSPLHLPPLGPMLRLPLCLQLL